jgi:hypothetical protein
MSKKILSLALVVVMLMSMFAFSTSAALTTGQIGIRVESDAVVGAPAGTVVTVKVYHVIPDGEDVQLTAANISLGYDNTAFSVDATTFAWGSTYANYFKLQSNTCNAATTISNNIVKNFGAADTANGWNAGVQVQQAMEGSTYTTKTGYAVDTSCEIFSLQFTALKEITASDVIGVVTGAYGKGFFSIKAFNPSSTAGTLYAAENVVLSEGLATPASPVFHVQNQYRPNGANYDLGLKFGFLTKNIGIEFNEKGTSTNIAAVGATLKVNGVAASEPIEQNFVYDVKGDNSEYHFRVIISNVAKASTDKYEVTTYVKYTNGTIRYADPVTVTAADVLPA